MEITLILHNIRSAFNVGTILRTAEGFGVRDVVFSGYTPRFDDSKLLPHLRTKLNQQIGKVSLGAEQWLNLQSCDDLAAKLTQLKSQGEILVGLENNFDDPRVINLAAAREKFAQLPAGGKNGNRRVVLVLGEEVAGIPDELRSQLDWFVEIPMRGHKESFNVGIATAIALYELTK